MRNFILFYLGLIIIFLLGGCSSQDKTPEQDNQILNPGDLIWVKRAGGAEYDQCFGVRTLPDNSTVVTGCFKGTAIFGKEELNEIILTSAGGEDIFIARYNPDGSLAWAIRVGGTLDDCGERVPRLLDDSFIVTGYINGTVTFGDGESNETVLASEGETSSFNAQYNSDGTLVLVKSSTRSPYSDADYGIITLLDNSTVVTGVLGGTATFGSGESNETELNPTSRADCFIARYNPDGTLAWVKQAGGSNWVDRMSGKGVTVLSDYSAVVTGYFRGMATFGRNEPNETVLTSVGATAFGYGGPADDIFIARYNPDGTLAWAKCAGGSTEDWGYGITALSDNSSVVTGKFWAKATFGAGEPNELELTSLGYFDIFIARYNPDGTLVWAKRAGSLTDDCGYEVTTLSDDSTVVIGSYEGTATFGEGEANETILTSEGGQDIFIARFAP